jgi:predicted metal-dependent hydrolase
MFKNLLSQKSKSITIDSLGPIHLHKSTRARRLTINIQPYKGVHVSIPRGVSFAQAEEFARSKIGWISRHLRKIKQMEQQHQNFKDGSPPIDRQVAKRILMERLDELAGQNSFHYGKVVIRNQTTRWGSCSVKNNISLNQKLVRLPQPVIDYVILHELVHTKIKNHSRKFWIELGEYVPDPKSLNKELRKYATQLI